jgi:hypothetical protein
MITRHYLGISLLALNFSTYAQPTVKFVTDAYGFVVTQPFSLKIQFSEPVSGLRAYDINITNATVTSLIGTANDYTAQVVPIVRGQMTVSIPANVTQSIAGNSPNEASSTLNMLALDTNIAPSSNFDLSRWDLVLPTPLTGGNSATRIKSLQLNTNYSYSPYFYTDPKTGTMNFFAPLGGSSTPNSNYARSELAENTSLQWSLSTFADNRLTASLVIKQVPSNGRITIGQIHDRGNKDLLGNIAPNMPMIKLMYDTRSAIKGQTCGGCIYAQIRLTPNTASNSQMDVVIATGIKLNQSFTYSIGLTNNGVLTVKAANKSKAFNLGTAKNNNTGWGSQYFLFHAGTYLHSDGASTTTGGETRFSYLNIKHTKTQ